MALTRRDIADDFDAVDEQIAELNAHKSDVLNDYRAQLSAEGMTKPEIKLEVEATKAAIKRLRAVAKDAMAVEEKDALVEEIADEIARSRARRTTRVENIDEFGVDQRAEPIPEHDADGVITEPQSAPQAAQMARTEYARESSLAEREAVESSATHSPEAAQGETGMVLGTGKERPLSIGLHTDGDPEARFESASLHQPIQPETAEQTVPASHPVRTSPVESETVAISTPILQRPRPPRPEGCQRPDACGSSTWRRRCHTCERDFAATQSEAVQ